MATNNAALAVMGVDAVCIAMYCNVTPRGPSRETLHLNVTEIFGLVPAG
jgi:hypothetical protein